LGDCCSLEVAHISGPLFPRKKGCINFGKNVLGYILGDFFTSTSGHPAQQRPSDLISSWTATTSTAGHFALFIKRVTQILMTGVQKQGD
jgi:hypothetical protein